MSQPSGDAVNPNCGPPPANPSMYGAVEVWPQLLEIAWSDRVGGWSSLGEGGKAHEVWKAITGRNAEKVFELSSGVKIEDLSGQDLFNVIVGELGNGAVFLHSRDDIERGPDIGPNHCLYVTRVDVDSSGTPVLIIKNPHDASEDVEVTAAELDGRLYAYSVGY